MAKNFKSYINNFELKEKGKATFQSYIDFNVDDEDHNENNEEVEKEASAFFCNLPEPNMLQGEKVIAKAGSVLKFAPFTDMKQGISGNLFVTNFKIAFTTADKSSYPDGHNSKLPQRNKLLENSDVPLTSVDSIYSVGSGTRKKKLSPGDRVSSSIKYLEIHCKDFQVHVFGFKFAQKEQSRLVTDAIILYSYPTDERHLFAYDFSQNVRFQANHPFTTKEDWMDELKRLNCDNMWDVSSVNLNHFKSANLPEYFVVPKKMRDFELSECISQNDTFTIPTWSYTYKNKASMLRMAQNAVESDTGSGEIMNKAIRDTNGRREVLTLDMGEQCPALIDIRNSFEKLKNIIIMDSAQEFYRSDSRWLNNLENCQWLQHVSHCLHTANQVVHQLVSRWQTVILKEETGTDLNCVISCLAQILMDPEYRTISGFQNLVEREWVVMGHQFQRRLCLIHKPESVDTKQIPVFLLFLDCVWQIMQQFPSSFAFTETYLTSLWDTLHMGIFYNFLFNSSYHLRKSMSDSNSVALSLPSAWDWRFQLSEEQFMLFNNPLHVVRNSYDLNSVVNGDKTALRLSGQRLRENQYKMHLGHPLAMPGLFPTEDRVLVPKVTSGLIKLWAQCYLRWIVPAQIIGGGNPSQYLQQCVLAEEVHHFHHRLQMLTSEIEEHREKLDEGQEQRNVDYDQGDSPDTQLCLDPRNYTRPQSGLVFGAKGYQSRDSSLSSVYITSSYPFSPGVSQATQHSFICGPLSHYLKDTAIDHDYDQDIND